MAKALDPQLKAPDTKAKVSVARCPDYWYVACASKDLKSEPLALTILGIPMVLFRTKDGTPGALLDRCPHRNVPLSMGDLGSPTRVAVEASTRARPGREGAALAPRRATCEKRSVLGTDPRLRGTYVPLRMPSARSCSLICGHSLSRTLQAE